VVIECWRVPRLWTSLHSLPRQLEAPEVVVSAYCVFFCRTHRRFLRAKKFVIGANSAMLAIQAVTDKNAVSRDRSRTWHAESGIMNRPLDESKILAIQGIVAHMFGLQPEELSMSRRERAVAMPRHGYVPSQA
jgi:hypothetical protein